MKIKLGVNAPPLHEQLSVEPADVKREQVLLDLVKVSVRMGCSPGYVREQHLSILKLLREKGLIGAVKRVIK